MNLEYGPVPVIFRVSQAECGIHMLVAASQECVNTYSTRRQVRLKVLCAPMRFDCEFPIIKTTKPLVESRSDT